MNERMSLKRPEPSPFPSHFSSVGRKGRPEDAEVGQSPQLSPSTEWSGNVSGIGWDRMDGWGQKSVRISG